MAHRKMCPRTLRRLVLLGNGQKHDPELAMVRAPCRRCRKVVSFCPQSTRERFGVRCLYCLAPFCAKCGEKHFERYKPRKSRSNGRGARWYGRRRRKLVSFDTRFKRIDKKLTQLLARK